MINHGSCQRGAECWWSHDPDRVAAAKAEKFQTQPSRVSGEKILTSGSSPEKTDPGHGMTVDFDEKRGQPGYAQLVIWETEELTTNISATELNEAGVCGLLFRPSLALNCVRAGFMELAGLLHPGCTLPDGSQLGPRRAKALMAQLLALVKECGSVYSHGRSER